MKFGISQIHEEIYCDNCKKLLSTDGAFDGDYCPRCGTPLTSIGIEEYNSNLAEQKEMFVHSLIELHKQQPSLSFKQLLDEFLKK